MENTQRLTTALAGRYAIEHELGHGGMATVYLARDVKYDRPVALKVLRPELTAALGAERFLREVRISARLDHPHILTLIDSGESDGFLWYVLPYVHGESLRETLNRERQLELGRALTITRQIAAALDYAHRQGVIHRDIKPENILLHEGEAMLADFGIAMAVREAGGSRLTESGQKLGTPQYMSPEQATGERQLDARSDVYSLGAVLFERTTLPESEAIVMALDATSGIAAAHHLEIVHRDLKPSNLMITADGRAKVLDFGLAMRLRERARPDASTRDQADASLTGPGTLAGTLAYMSPEQLRGGSADVTRPYPLVKSLGNFNKKAETDTFDDAWRCSEMRLPATTIAPETPLPNNHFRLEIIYKNFQPPPGPIPSPMSQHSSRGERVITGNTPWSTKASSPSTSRRPTRAVR